MILQFPTHNFMIPSAITVKKKIYNCDFHGKYTYRGRSKGFRNDIFSSETLKAETF